jgi:cell wall-associated NlpC family hydrolase
MYKWKGQNFTPFFGGELEQAVKAFQRQKGLKVDGIIGTATHEALERSHVANKPKLWAFDSVAINLADNFCGEYTKQSVREAIVAAGFYWYDYRMRIAYRQIRPYPKIKPPTVPTWFDCSSYYTVCCYAGGAPDPNGRNYDGQGYTGTLISNGHRVGSVNDLEPGDAVFYGNSDGWGPAFSRGDPTHIAMYVGTVNGTHSVLSMGHYPMGLYPYNYRGVNHFRHYEIGEV